MNFPFCLLIYWITIAFFPNVNQPYIVWISSTVSWFLILFMFWRIPFDRILWRIFYICVFLGYWFLVSFFFCTVFGFGSQVNAGLTKLVVTYLFLLGFLEEFVCSWISSFLKYFIEFTNKAIWAQHVLCRFLTVTHSIPGYLFFSWVDFGSLSFKELFILSKLLNLLV